MFELLADLATHAETIETHLSWVLLTEQRAYKRKKPLRLPYLDFRTVEQRRYACEHELRLGRRLAPTVYDAVVPLVVTPRGLALGGEGEVVDWVVVMRRLPADRMLPAMLARNAASIADADAVGDVLAAFYREAPRTGWSGAEYRRRMRDLVVTHGRELAERETPRPQLDAVVNALLGAIEREGHALEARVVAGRIVDAHGDLRPEHICLETPPVVIDPLEFDDQLRMLDAVSELAFLALECERLRASWFGVRVFARYAERTGDRSSPALVAIYRGQHALTRALIAMRRIDDATAVDRTKWRDKALDYLSRIACGLPLER